jgi:hypothetical protein
MLVVGVSEVNACSSQSHMESKMMLAAQWRREPRHMISPTDVVMLDTLRRSADHASRNCVGLAGRPLLVRNSQIAPPDSER